MTSRSPEFRSEARAWLAANVPSQPSPEDGPASREYVLAWQRKQAQGGWAGIAWPTEVGGRGLSVLEQIVWFEEYARAGAPSPLNASFVGLNHAGPDVDRLRHARAEGLPSAEDPGGRCDLVSGLLGARFWLRSCEPENARSRRRRRARHRRPQDLVELRRHRGLSGAA